MMVSGPLHDPTTLPLGKQHLVPIKLGAMWAPDREKNLFPLMRIDPCIVQSIAWLLYRLHCPDCTQIIKLLTETVTLALQRKGNAGILFQIQFFLHHMAAMLVLCRY